METPNDLTEEQPTEANAGGCGDEARRRVKIRFTTVLGPTLQEPSSFDVPASSTRRDISRLLNGLLKNANPDHELLSFDFLIGGELLLRQTLEEFLLEKGTPALEDLVIEYLKAVPRLQDDSAVHDEGITSLDGSNPDYVLTGSYDCIARLWKSGTKCTHILAGHTDRIHSVHIINGKTESENILHIATASEDRSLRLWKLNVFKCLVQPVHVKQYKILLGHELSVRSVSSDPSGHMICSSSWDETIKLWKVKNFEDDDDIITIKKQKLNSGTSNHLDVSVSTLEGHSNVVNSVVWTELETIFSASWDCSIRKWDVQTGKVTWLTDCGKELNCLDSGGESSALIAAGGSDRTLQIWDPRKPGTSDRPILELSPHSGWITSCKWHRKSPYNVLTSCTDAKVMLWDLRTKFPLARIDANAHDNMAFRADWWKEDCIISGGGDKRLFIHSGVPIQ